MCQAVCRKSSGLRPSCFKFLNSPLNFKTCRLVQCVRLASPSGAAISAIQARPADFDTKDRNRKSWKSLLKPPRMLPWILSKSIFFTDMALLYLERAIDATKKDTKKDRQCRECRRSFVSLQGIIERQLFSMSRWTREKCSWFGHATRSVVNGDGSPAGARLDLLRGAAVIVRLRRHHRPGETPC